MIVATNHYYELARDLLVDIETKWSLENSEVFIFTNQKFNLINSNRIEIRHIAIGDEPWPDITLFRFQKLINFAHLIRGNYVIWSDADMRLVRSFEPKKLLKHYEIALSRHPGFSFGWHQLCRRRNIVELAKMFHRLKVIWMHRFNPQGWELSKLSAAYVPLRKRKTYVQGGFWIAKKEAAIKMSNSINEQIEQDLYKDYIPFYHDETYLNWYFAFHNCGLLPRDFVIVENYYWQNVKSGYVVCVDKGNIKAL